MGEARWDQKKELTINSNSVDEYSLHKILFLKLVNTVDKPIGSEYPEVEVLI